MDMNDFKNELKSIAERYGLKKGDIKTEEATKNALVMPFIKALGYDVFNPSEVIPEFTADFGTKLGEKVDYAIMKDDKIIMLFECKTCTSALDDCHASQLFRYFSTLVTKSGARFAILTNGLVYHFFSDLDAQNQMDEKPFFEFNILDINDDKINELKKFCQRDFVLDSILSTANDLKFTNGFQQVIEREFAAPTEDFVRFIAPRVYSKKLTQGIVAKFQPLVQKAFNQFIFEKVEKQLSEALARNKQRRDEELSQEKQLDQEKPVDQDKKNPSEEELEAFYIVKCIVGELSGVFDRIVNRKLQSAFVVMVDDNIRCGFCRFIFNASHKQLLIRQPDDSSKSIEILFLADIYKHKEEILNACKLVIQKRPVKSVAD